MQFFVLFGLFGLGVHDGLVLFPTRGQETTQFVHFSLNVENTCIDGRHKKRIVGHYAVRWRGRDFTQCIEFLFCSFVAVGQGFQLCSQMWNRDGLERGHFLCQCCHLQQCFLLIRIQFLLLIVVFKVKFEHFTIQ